MASMLFRRVVPPCVGSLKALSTVPTARVHSRPVKNLSYGWWAYILGEETLPRFNKNSKIFTIEGNLASGKGALAQKLADEYGMLYMPEPDVYYLNVFFENDVPLKKEFHGNCCLETFYLDPKASDGNSYRLQHWMYVMRYLQYAKAVEHLLATGQGVILERSPFSDKVFLESMFKEGYIHKRCFDHYYTVRGNSIDRFLHPHLVIYLDVPAEDVQKKLKESEKPYLQNVSLSYLKGIETAYKTKVLPEISKESELLRYDPIEVQDLEKILEDIDSLTFKKGHWHEQNNHSFHYMRMFVQDTNKILPLVHLPIYLPEITMSAHETDAFWTTFRSLPGQKYAKGYNADVGDKYIWLK
ncbi:hypothetical protein DNTS_016442 [Danionella cerebrum]|uniref:NADH dehydrogenase [ubiquinone] 1 alpha subcomplex subunit 10, mitochondrial n=1 Tax=Danionella cerebrum TaxID=2873325 RepID=A0A553N5K0_9TELE|nr:hypothetical protein DNTS_016442 [Danionella translucida]